MIEIKKGKKELLRWVEYQMVDNLAKVIGERRKFFIDMQEFLLEISALHLKEVNKIIKKWKVHFIDIGDTFPYISLEKPKRKE